MPKDLISEDHINMLQCIIERRKNYVTSTCTLSGEYFSVIVECVTHEQPHMLSLFRYHPSITEYLRRNWGIFWNMISHVSTKIEIHQKNIAFEAFSQMSRLSHTFIHGCAKKLVNSHLGLRTHTQTHTPDALPLKWKFTRFFPSGVVNRLNVIVW